MILSKQVGILAQGMCALAQGRCTLTPPLSWGQTYLQVGGVYYFLSKNPMVKGPPLKQVPSGGFPKQRAICP